MTSDGEGDGLFRTRRRTSESAQENEKDKKKRQTEHRQRKTRTDNRPYEATKRKRNRENLLEEEFGRANKKMRSGHQAQESDPTKYRTEKHTRIYSLPRSLKN